MAESRKPLRREEAVKKLVTLDESEVFDEVRFSSDLEIDASDLQGALVKHSGHYWLYGKLHALGIRLQEKKALAYEIAKRAHDTLEAQLNEVYRRELLLASGASDGKLKVTEKLIDSKVQQDERFLESQSQLDDLKTELIDLEHTVSILALAEKIFSKRTDILTTLGYMFQGGKGADTAGVMSKHAIASRENESLRGAASQIRRRTE